MANEEGFEPSAYSLGGCPHVHVYYGEYIAVIGIDGELLAGKLPTRQLKMITGWLALHEEEAYAAWNLAVSGEHFEKIKPLR